MGYWTCRAHSRLDMPRDKARAKEYHAEYRARNKERLREKNAEYRARNKERLKEKHAEYYARNKAQFKEKRVEYNARNKERIREKNAEYRASNKERRREYLANYRARNEERLKEKRAEYYARNKEKFKEINAEYRARNKEQRKQYNAEYYARNKAQVKEYNAEFRAHPLQRLKMRIRDRLRSIKRCGRTNLDVRNAERFIGCTWEQMLEHLGGDIPSGYELDHIIPLCKYDLNNPEDLHNAFNYRNTQLLSFSVHRKKGTKLPDQSVLLQLQDLWPAEWKVGM